MKIEITDQQSLRERQAEPNPEKSLHVIAPGIVASLEAMRRDLPQLLTRKRLVGQWVAYHSNERIGIAPDKRSLVRACLQRGLTDAEFFVGKILAASLAEL